MTDKPPGRWLKPAAAAELLGVPETRVRDWIRDAALPAIRDGGRWYLKKTWVEDFAATREQQALSQQQRLRQRRSWNRRAG